MPGISYLAQSPAYFEMLDNRRKQKLRRGIPTMTTRRMITENRISSNIMAYNQASAIKDFGSMEVSTNYHTQVSVNKYVLSTPREDSSLLNLANSQKFSGQLSIMGPSYRLGSESTQAGSQKPQLSLSN